MKNALILTGPTATGKTSFGVKLARKLGAEIVSADSRQVYKGLDIGTAKPTAAERAEIPHHLLDVYEITERSDVYKFRQICGIRPP